MARGNDADRSSVLSLQNLQLGNASGQPIALLLSGTALGFVAILGVLALIGIQIRNSIILVHEIEKVLHQGRSRWQAVLEGTDSRARPILLTEAAPVWR